MRRASACKRDVSNERAETRLIEKSYTDEEIAAIAQKHKMPRYPKIALLREKLSRKASFNEDGSDTSQVPHGEPYAGKLLVRFDEG